MITNHGSILRTVKSIMKGGRAMDMAIASHIEQYIFGTKINPKMLVFIGLVLGLANTAFAADRATIQVVSHHSRAALTLLCRELSCVLTFITHL